MMLLRLPLAWLVWRLMAEEDAHCHAHRDPCRPTAGPSNVSVEFCQADKILFPSALRGQQGPRHFENDLAGELENLDCKSETKAVHQWHQLIQVTRRSYTLGLLVLGSRETGCTAIPRARCQTNLLGLCTYLSVNRGFPANHNGTKTVRPATAQAQGPRS